LRGHLLQADEVRIVCRDDVEDCVQALLNDLLEPNVVSQNFDNWLTFIVDFAEVTHLEGLMRLEYFQFLHFSGD